MLLLMLLTVHYTISEVAATKNTDVQNGQLTDPKSLLLEEDLASKFLREESETKKVARRNSKIHQQHVNKHAQQHKKEQKNPKGRSNNRKPHSNPPGNHKAKIDRSPEDMEHERLYKESLKPQKDSHEKYEDDF